MIEYLDCQDRAQIRKVMAEIGADRNGQLIMRPKAEYYTFRLRAVDNRALSILKQEMLSLGGDAAVSTIVSRFVLGESDALLMGTRRQLGDLCRKLRLQPFGLRTLGILLADVLDNITKPPSCLELSCGRVLDFAARTQVMAVINTTPDSFSDGGNYCSLDTALAHAHQCIAAGADILDIGGESSRPGATPVPQSVELARTVPLIKAIRKFSDIPISIDTYKASVAAAALAAGADIVNDISALGDPQMAAVVARVDAVLVLMHMQGRPQTMQQNPQYRNIVTEITTYLQLAIDRALAAGISENKIIIDPGIGFGKSVADNLVLVKRLFALQVLGKPVLLGTSRKSFIGKTLGGEPDERLEGTVASVVLGISQGANIVRVHDVAFVKRAILMADAILRS